MPDIGPQGMEFLGSLRLSAAAVTTGVLTIAPREKLFVDINIAGYSGGDIASLRFNGDAGANYWSRHITWATAGTTATDVPNAAATLIRLGGNAVTQGRSVTCSISNVATVSKYVGISHLQTGTNSTAVGVLNIGGGEWFNTTAQITSIEMRTAGGSITMPTGTGFSVYGSNP
jgi:hypothetical protein